MSNAGNISGAQLDTLVALVERGPLWDGDVPSKAGRDDLIKAGLAVRVIVLGEDGHTAATYLGRNAYKETFGNEDTISEAKAVRIARKVIVGAKHHG